MSSENYQILEYLGILSAFAPPIVLLLCKNKTLQNSWRVLFVLSFCWLSIDVINSVMAYNGLNTHLNSHIYDGITTILYIWWFHYQFSDPKLSKWLKRVGFGYLTLTFSIIILNSSYFKPVTANIILAALIPIALSLFSFYRIFKSEKQVRLLDEPVYWISSAILIHFGMSLVAWITFELTFTNSDIYYFVWPIVIISNIFYNILFSIGAWKMRRT